MLKNNGTEKGGVMEELELDYVIIKLKKKSPCKNKENS
jgi:hypothetical protein